MLEKSKRKMLLRVASEYRTRATRVIQVVTGTISIDIVVDEREYLYNTRNGYLAAVKKEAMSNRWKHGKLSDGFYAVC